MGSFVACMLMILVSTLGTPPADDEGSAVTPAGGAASMSLFDMLLMGVQGLVLLAALNHFLAAASAAVVLVCESCSRQSSVCPRAVRSVVDFFIPPWERSLFLAVSRRFHAMIPAWLLSRVAAVGRLLWGICVATPSRTPAVAASSQQKQQETGSLVAPAPAPGPVTSAASAPVLPVPANPALAANQAKLLATLQKRYKEYTEGAKADAGKATATKADAEKADAGKAVAAKAAAAKADAAKANAAKEDATKPAKNRRGPRNDAKHAKSDSAAVSRSAPEPVSQPLVPHAHSMTPTPTPASHSLNPFFGVHDRSSIENCPVAMPGAVQNNIDFSGIVALLERVIEPRGNAPSPGEFRQRGSRGSGRGNPGPNALPNPRALLRGSNYGPRSYFDRDDVEGEADSDLDSQAHVLADAAAIGAAPAVNAAPVLPVRGVSYADAVSGASSQRRSRSRARAVAPQPAAQAVAPQPAAQAVAPQPAAQAVAPQPAAQVVAPQPAAQAVAPQPAAQAVAPRPAAQVAAPQPAAPQPVAQVAAPQPAAQAAVPLPAGQGQHARVQPAVVNLIDDHAARAPSGIAGGGPLAALPAQASPLAAPARGRSGTSRVLRSRGAQ